MTTKLAHVIQPSKEQNVFTELTPLIKQSVHTKIEVSSKIWQTTVIN